MKRFGFKVVEPIETELPVEIILNPEVRALFERADRLRKQMADEHISVVAYRRRHRERFLEPDDQ